MKSIFWSPKGEVFDYELISFLISWLLIVLIEYIPKKYRFNYLDLIDKGNNKLPLPEEKLEEILEQFIFVFQDGIKI